MKNNIAIGVFVFAAIFVCIAIGFCMGWESNDRGIVPNTIPVVDTMLPPPPPNIPQEALPSIEDVPEEQGAEMPNEDVYLYQPQVPHLIDLAYLPRDSLRPCKGSKE